MEYCPCGDIGDILKKERRFGEEVARIYISEIILALEYLHSKGIIYRDLKPDNIILDEQGHVKLTDFGLSKEIEEGDEKLTYTFCGTPQYLAPEIISKTGYNCMIDWWSLGILMYEIVVGFPPFNHKSN